MKRIALIGVILGILLAADGAYMVAIKYNGGETQAWNLPDGWIIIISAAIILVASLVALVLPSKPASAAEVTHTKVEPEAKAEVETGQV